MLAGKVILVAGAGGIGGGLARRYAAEGARVVLGDIDLDAARETVDEIQRENGDATAIHLDGADEKSVIAAVETCRKTYGGLDGLHANFANLADNNPELGILELPLEIYDETQRVNARGFYLCTRAALPLMIERGGGSIVYTSSAAANAKSPAQVAYAMSKAAGGADAACGHAPWSAGRAGEYDRTGADSACADRSTGATAIDRLGPRGGSD